MSPLNSSGRLWRQITLTLPLELEAEATALLIDLAAGGVWVEPADRFIRLRVFFPSEERGRVEAMRSGLRARGIDQEASVASALLPEEEWQTAWQRHSVPIQRIGKRLLIGAPWHFPLANPTGRKVIQIAPGMAFGTGTHATTRSCLTLLETLISGRRRGPLLDLGTGSGILAIAAVRLGMAAVTAVENDPVALAAAKKNARVNGVASRILFRKTIPSEAQYRWGVANLTGPLLLSLSERWSALIPPRGKLILSGMLKTETAGVLARYRKRFLVLKKLRRGEWVTLLMERKRGN
ncbi:MAG: 50S ribosomal protein L11 methyltransferase [Nitrospirae bacterium]|nr:50S ribosomal protein L11 methyltransferase [Candidatus Manganitrophaceae bacterium]